jgi:trimeric autotransporter adhesin
MVQAATSRDPFLVSMRFPRDFRPDAESWAHLLASDDRFRIPVRVRIDALAYNIHGQYNTALGSTALFNNTGYYNTAVGSHALQNDGGDNFNTAVGDGSLQELIGTGSSGNNTAIGYQSLNQLATGTLNVAVGDSAGIAYTSGESSNIVIGRAGVASESNTIRIGTDGGATPPAGTQNSVFIAGIVDQTETSMPVYVDASGHLGVTVSSQRFKKDIQDMGASNEAILALHPVTFRYKTESEEHSEHFGLIAEQVAKVSPDLVVHDKDGQVLTVRYDAVNAMLLNEFQKQHAQVVEQATTISAQQKEIEDQKAQVAALAAQFAELKKEMEQK